MFDKRKGNTEPEVDANPNAPASAAAPSFNTRSTAMIGKSIVVKGNITGAETLVVEGSVEGSIDLPNNDLTVGESGRVSADLNAKVIKVAGQVTGDMVGAETVVISKTGKVQGNITAPRVTLEDGAKFKGSIDMDPGDSKAASTQAKSAMPRADGNNDKPKTSTQEAG